MSVQEKGLPPVSIFISYASADQALQQQLVKHLSALQHQGVITTWYDRNIVAGTDRTQVIDQHITEASIILLLISADFLASDYYYSYEMQRALELHERGLALVIPVLLRPTDWKETPFAHLQSLPRGGKAITLSRNRDQAFLDVVKDIRVAIKHLQVLLTSQETISLSFHKYLPISKNSDRQIMLERVWKMWIEQFLHQSLHNAILIALGLYEQPNAVTHPWQPLIQEMRYSERSLPIGMPITQVYYDAHRSLLILGEPGCGKTTLLLHLAQHLLLQAGRDEKLPMPVVLNLSSWAQKQLPLPEWIVEELQRRYHVPTRLSQAWIATDMLHLLLDGLDEVDVSCRIACINTLNQYREQHGFTAMVVCSRTTEYLAQKHLLALQNAVIIQPLIEEQMMVYLKSTGPQFEALQRTLHEDAGLRVLAQTPLMLNMMVLAYQGRAIDSHLLSGSIETRRRHIFVLYVDRVLHRREEYTHYSFEQTVQWLTHLAQYMQRKGISDFYLEQMQPAWLQNRLSSRLYQSIVGGLVGGGILGPPAGIILALIGSLGVVPLLAWYWFFCLGRIRFIGVGFLQLTRSSVLATWINFFLCISFSVLICCLAIGVVSACVYGLLKRGQPSIHPVEVIVWSWKRMSQESMRAFCIAVVGTSVIQCLLAFNALPFFSLGASAEIIGTLPSLEVFLLGLLGASLLGPGSGLVGGFIVGLAQKIIQQKHLLGKNVLTGLAVGLLEVPTLIVLTLFGWVAIPAMLQWKFESVSSLILAVLSAICTSLIAGLIFGVSKGFLRKELDKHEQMKPNEGIHRSLHHAVWTMFLVIGIVLLIGITVGHLIDMLSGTPLTGLKGGVVVSIGLGLPLGLYFGLLTGGYAYTQHFLLRLFLWRNHSLPWNYSRFLDYSAKSILLRKVGGGYIFIHKLLQEYFASLDTSK